VAVLGAGKIGLRHVEAYREIEGAVLTGLLEPHAGNRTAALTRLTPAPHIYRSFEEVLEDPDVDIVDVCTPTPVHFEQVSRALAAGKSVFCEKPLVATSDEIARIEALFADRNTSLRVGYVYRFHPRIQRLKHRLDHEALGRPRLAVFRIGGRGSHRAWKHERGSAGGALMDMASHMLDLATWLFGPIDEIQPLFRDVLLPKREIEGVLVAVDADDVVVFRLRSATGVEILVHADFVSPGFSNLVEVAGDNGSALVSVVSGIPDRYVLNSPAGDLPAGETFEPGDTADMLRCELEAFMSDFDAGIVVQETDASTLVARVAEAFGA
jgi:predicted dehydrogenase